MAPELSKILEHVERMDELDLDGVEPTSHVVELENVLREDVPRPEPVRREHALEQAPDASPTAASACPARARRELDLLELTAAAAGGADRAPATPPPAEVFEFWRERAAADDLGAYLWVADEAPGRRRRAPAPFAVKDLFCVEGVPSTAGSRILEGYRPPYTATSVRNLQAAGAPVLGKTNQDEFAMGSSNENSGYRPRAEPVGPHARARAARAAAAPRPWPPDGALGDRHRHRAARSASPPRCAGSSGLKPTYGAVSRYGMIAFASSLDQCGPLTRDVTDAALLLRHLEGRDPCDSTSLGIPGRDRAAERPSGSTACASASGGSRRRASSPAWRRSCAAHARAGSRSSAATVEEVDLPQRRARPLRLLRDRAGRGERQPRPLRRRALRPARRATAT